MREDYRNIPTDYVVRQALAALLLIVGVTGFVLGMFMHYLGPKEGLISGLWALSCFVSFREPKADQIVYRLSFTLLSAAVAALSVAGAFLLHSYYLLFGACLLLGVAVQLNVRTPKRT
jgi:hypothetical protein